MPPEYPTIETTPPAFTPLPTYSPFPAAKIRTFFLSVTDSYRILPHFTEIYRILPILTASYRFLPIGGYFAVR